MKDVNQPLFLCEVQTKHVVFKEDNYSVEFDRPLIPMVAEFNHPRMHLFLFLP